MIVPIGNKILVKPTKIEEETVLASGIVIENDTTERPVTGEVMAVGAGSINVMGAFIPMTVKIGDKVLMSKYTGIPVKYDSIDYLIFKEEELLGVIHND